MNVKQINEKLNNWLEQHQEINLALLFGSYARGEARNDSDVDLAIACDIALNAKQKLRQINELNVLLKREVDLIDLKTVGQPLLGRIMSEAKLLKGTETDYAELAIRNVNMNEDFLPYIERVQKERRDRFLHG